MGNAWWDKLKSKIRTFAADYSRRLNLDRLAAQTALDQKVDRAVKSRDSGDIALAKTDMASLLIKKDQALVVRARLKRMSSEASNMAAELRSEEARNASQRHIACVTLPDRRTVTTNEGICEAFRDILSGAFHQGAGLSPAQFDAYLAEFPCLEAAVASRCVGPISESEIWEAMKQVCLDKSPGLGGLRYEVYFRQSPVFVPLLALIFGNWMKQGSIPQRFTRGVIMLCKDKNGGDGLGNFRPLCLTQSERFWIRSWPTVCRLSCLV